MKNIHVLTTDKLSRIFYDISVGKLKLSSYTPEPSVWFDNRHIYITSDEAIKEGDWVYRYNSNDVFKADNFLIHLIERGSTEVCKKIILTTDSDLIKDGVQAIDDEFLKWFVKNTSCGFVEVDYRYDTNLKPIFDSFGNKVLRIKIPTESENLSKIIIPKEEPKQEKLHRLIKEKLDENKPKQETFEESAERLYPTTIDSFTDNGFDLSERERLIFINGAKWQQEQDKKLYSEKEVLDLLNRREDYMNSEGDIFNYQSTKQWFEEFKKK